MKPPVAIVTLGKVLPEMAAAALFTPQGRPRNQTTDGDEMQSPKEFSIVDIKRLPQRSSGRVET